MKNHPGYTTGAQCVAAANMVRLRSGAPLIKKTNFIRNHTHRDQYAHIVSSRPFIKHTHFGVLKTRSYFVPELAHIGSVNTRHKR